MARLFLALLLAGEAAAAADERSCDSGESCAALAKRYRTGDGVRENIALAMAYWRTACDLGHQASCDELQGVLENGLSGAVRTLKRRPAEKAGRRSVAPVDEREQIVTRGLKRAAAVFDARCRGGEGDACYQIGTMLEAGTGVRQDLPRAADAYEQACVLDVRHGCLEGGRLLGAGGRRLERDVTRALKLDAKACLDGVVDGCVAAGALLERADEVVAHVERARRYYQLACDGGAPLGCAGLVYLDARAAENSLESRARALELYEEACRMGRTDACQDAEEIRPLVGDD